MTNQPEFDRYITLEGSYNIRDVGGYITQDGRRVRWRRVLRSDSLHALTLSSQQVLRDHGLRTIIDLRRPSEAARKPNVFATVAGMDYRNMPLFDDHAADTVDAPAETLQELYVRYVDMCQAQFGAILNTVAATADAPLLVHCAVGKDRTGLVIALTLAALGVAPETIAQDYALSYARLEPLFDRERTEINPERLARFERMIQSPREAMEHVLAHIDARYGGIDAYIASLGLGGPQIERLRSELLEE